VKIVFVSKQSEMTKDDTDDNGNGHSTAATKLPTMHAMQTHMILATAATKLQKFSHNAYTHITQLI
jgi:hypothetical protein